MSFICPECNAPELRITQRLELPPDGRSDEIALQIVICHRCGFRGIAIYEESRRGSFGSEARHHDGYNADSAVLNKLSSLIAHCPAPGSRQCQCPTHKILGQTNARGIWRLPNWLKMESRFALIIV